MEIIGLREIYQFRLKSIALSSTVVIAKLASLKFWSWNVTRTP